MSVRTFMYICIAFIARLYIIFFIVMILTNSISNEFKANNVIIVLTDKFNTITISNEHIRLYQTWI